MSRSGTILLVLAAAVAVVAYVEIRLPGPVPPMTGADDAEVRDLAARVEALEARADRPEVPVRAAGPDAPTAGREDPVAGGGDPEPAAAGPGGPKTPATPEARAAIDKRIRGILEQVRAGSLERDELNDLWETLPGSGLEDDAVAAFTAHVKAHPDDAEGHYGLGVALTTKFLGGATSQLEVMKLSGQADRAFSRALEIDDHHFEARYSKAISYTFYPAIAGKGPEAIRHFETLVQRHGSDGSNDMMKDVYFNLGNEYRKAGNLQKAKEAYRQGLGVFPDSKEIRTALEAMD